jgi:hypothetical protein
MPKRYCAKERADRERRLGALAVAVLTALGERDALVRDAERRAVQALLTMTDEEGLSLREAVDWWQRRHNAGDGPATPPGARDAQRRQSTSAPPVNGAPHWPANDDDRVGLARGGCARQSAVLGHGRDNELCQRVGPGPGGVVGARSAAWLHSCVSSDSAGSPASDCVLGAVKVQHPVGAPPMAGPAWRVGAARGAGMVRARSGELGWR